VQLFTNRAKELKPGGMMVAAISWENDALTDSFTLANQTFPFSFLPHPTTAGMALPVVLFSESAFDSFFHHNISHLFEVVAMKKQAMTCPYYRRYEMDEDLQHLAESVFDAIVACTRPFQTHQMRRVGGMEEKAIDEVFRRWKESFVGRCIRERRPVKWEWGSSVVVLKKKWVK
jgi:hypothetical protein